MAWYELLYYVASAIAGVCATAIPMGIKLYNNIKAYRNAKTEAERAVAKNAIATELKRLVADAEQKYKVVNDFLKRQGSSAGTLKKAYVEQAIKAFCLENGFAYDMAEIDTAIEAEVEYTKSVN